MNLYEIQNIINEAFKDIQFDVFTHSYTLDNVSFISVSNLLSRFYNKFDKAIAINIAKKRGITVDELLSEWDEKKNESIKKGNSIHSFAEELFNKNVCTITTNDEYFDYKIGVCKYYKDIMNTNIFLGSEVKIFSKTYKYAGTIDLLLYNKDVNGIIVLDFKTNNDLFKTYNSMMLYPFDNYYDNNFNKYQIQLNLYKIALEEIGLNIVSCQLVHILPYDYKVYQIEDLTNTLKNYLWK